MRSLTDDEIIETMQARVRRGLDRLLDDIEAHPKADDDAGDVYAATERPDRYEME